MNNFITPKNIEELCNALRNRDDNTYILAGGTDLSIKFIKNQVFNFNIIDICKFEEFRHIEDLGDTIKIGSCVTMTELERSKVIDKEIPALIGAAYNLGSTQIRNRATIGGNIANAAQCGDTIPVLFAYDADIEILNSSKQIRYEKAREFVEGIGKTTLKSDEVITGIIVKKSKARSGFSKVGSRKSVTISKVNCCGKILLDDRNLVQEADIYMGAVGVKPIKAELIEKELIGKKLDNLGADLEEAVKEQIESAIPDRSSKHYKKIAAIGLVEDMLADIRR
ncbi:FAD binding domain-containing protein [Tissierella sp. Yu-01]|uniref:FAD binding domain-containing protein n=1 Tax=Tissierella sp. Yu-01 TaxID=3035694 RepID=UPI00240E7F86|nr:FAD binding domain-containing protein [Tissierella sp. Yu-01]WFA09082.1 FAD binding domain-containing protein [Tissierella sp. Yu-01]